MHALCETSPMYLPKTTIPLSIPRSMGPLLTLSTSFTRRHMDTRSPTTTEGPQLGLLQAHCDSQASSPLSGNRRSCSIRGCKVEVEPRPSPERLAVHRCYA